MSRYRRHIADASARGRQSAMADDPRAKSSLVSGPGRGFSERSRPRTRPRDRPREAHRSHGRCARRALTRGANISTVPGNKPLRSRRRLNTLTRKRITSYYTEEEQHEIARAAARLRISISGFVAGATLEQARLVNAAKPSSKRK